MQATKRNVPKKTSVCEINEVKYAPELFIHIVSDLRPNTGFLAQKSEFTYISTRATPFHAPGFHDIYHSISFRHTHLFTRSLDLTKFCKLHFSPFALPDDIDVLKALLATCLSQIGYPVHSTKSCFVRDNHYYISNI
jgi:hypothetical protein